MLRLGYASALGLAAAAVSSRSRPRRMPQPPAAAHGLYLARVEYPDSAYLQERAEGGAQRGASGDDDEADDGSAGDCDG